ncbi:MAG: Ppx/GppA phosphatase family protein [Bacteroidota bacterium]
MRIASIDIGTNTILMLIADVERDSDRYRFTVLKDELVIARLGKGVDEHRRILPAAFERIKEYLREYQRIARGYAVDTIIACGTSALRDAVNRDEFLAYMKKEIDLAIRILSGEEEARLTFRGAVLEYPLTHDTFGVIDIGGGSTEIVLGTIQKILNHISLDIGSVRLTERFLLSSPPTYSQLDEAASYIRATLSSAQFGSLDDTILVGVAGTVTTLAALHQQLPAYDREKVSGYKLSLEIIESIYEQLLPLTVEQIEAIPQIVHGRADIILAGVLILKEFMHCIHGTNIIASDRGLRYGIAMDALT